jgi:peptidoglycan/xylan/chitin deacetylase (PgdA/CDA1 family)
MSSRVVYLMYHEIELVGQTTCETEPGYTRYVVSEQEFRRQMSWLEAEGFQGVSVAEALKLTRWNDNSDRRPIVITFDDGSETDLIAAAPALKQSGFNATFYVIAGRLGKRGYLSEQQLRELSDEGFEIGCHSMTHRYLSELNENGLRVEVVEAKKRIEQIIGRRVASFSCPGGRWSAQVARVAREAGYDSLATSRTGANPCSADLFRLSRIAMMRGTSMTDYERLCRGEGLLMRRARAQLFDTAKGLLGNSLYEKVRSLVLSRT